MAEVEQPVMSTIEWMYGVARDLGIRYFWVREKVVNGMITQDTPMEDIKAMYEGHRNER